MSLPTEIRCLVDLLGNSRETEPTFKAILTLLGDVPDRRIIVDALDQIEIASIQNENLRNQAAILLDQCEAPEQAKAWRQIGDVSIQDNVVPLGVGQPISLRSDDDITFQDIGGLEDVKKQVRRKIINPFQGKRELFDRFRRKPGGGVLMYGPPGCGKTMLARALANECNARFVNVRAADILDRYVGNAEKQITRIFDEARTSRPVVIFFDEIEALGQRRQFDSTERVNTTVSALLTEMDGFNSNNDGILFLGATNVPWSLDSAFRRPGRFDRTIFVPPPDRIARKFILKTFLEDRPVSKSLNVDRIVEQSMGFSGADLSALVDTAIDIAIEEAHSDDQFDPLSDAHFKEAFQEVKSSVGEWLGQAKSFADYANDSGMYDDLASFLKKYSR